MAVTITGGSDDLIEVHGSIREEFSHYSDGDDDAKILGFSDGTLLRVIYDMDGIWRISPIAVGLAKLSKVEGIASEDTNDVVTLEGDITWVVCGEHYAKK